MRSLLMILLVLGMGACSYETPEEVIEEEEETEKIFAVQIQAVGSKLEGLTVCYDENNTCKKTNKEGVVEFDTFGMYSFKVRDIHVAQLMIDRNRTIVSPYTFFDENETLAQRAILLLHAFDKTEKFDDEDILLTLSAYIPDEISFHSLLAKTKMVPLQYQGRESILKYTTNDVNITDSIEHNISINFEDNNITRDDDWAIVISPKKKSYESLDIIMNFVDLAVDKNVTLDNFEEKYLLTKNSLTSFNLGERYVVTPIVKEDYVLVKFFDNVLQRTDESILVVNDIKDVLSTTLLDIRFKEPEVELAVELE